MAIRVIGGKDGNPGRVFKSTAGDGESEVGRTESGIETDGIQHSVDATDNSGESDTNGETEFVDINSINTGNSGSGGSYTGKRRGRKPGSRNNGTGSSSSGGRKSTSKTTDSIAAMLYTVHTVAGSLFKMNSIQITKASCNDLAEAMMEVSELYEIPLMSEKSLAWTNLAAVACKVYIFNGAASVVKDDKNGKVHVISDPISIPDFMRG